jgi:hypothetical protein
MALNTAKEAIESKRLELVASLRLRKRTQREIQAALAGSLVNPDTNEPYSLATINGDIKKLEREWRRLAAAMTDEYKAIQLAEIQEVKRLAWTEKDLGAVLRAIDLEANIKGTKAAQQTEVTGKDGGNVKIDVSSLTDAERATQIATILDVARTRQAGRALDDTESTE